VSQLVPEAAASGRRPAAGGGRQVHIKEDESSDTGRDGGGVRQVHRKWRAAGRRRREQRRVIDRWGRAGSTFNYDWQVRSRSKGFPRP